MEVQKQNNHSDFFVGQNIDALDKVNFWLNAEVLGVQNDQVFIHYTGWHPKYDELININTGRVLKQWEPLKPIKINNRIDVYHPVGGWLQARAIELGEPKQNEEITDVKVHFFKYHQKYDMWVNIKDKNQVAIIGQKSKGYGMGKRKRRIDQKLLSSLAREILRKKLQQMVRELEQKNFTMKEIGGDGNCLFRSISDQLYGQQTYHAQIRQMCMKYILQEKQFFQDFIVEDVEEYVARKSKDGVWGDDVQIEALSQIYLRPIEIYAMGIKPIRTFHEDNQQNIEPLRLAYIGSCHYNSIKKRGQQTAALIESKFGEYQTSFINSYIEYKQSQIYWINKNRDKFSHFNPLQMTIQERIQSETMDKPGLQDADSDLMKQAIVISENQHINEEIEAAQLKQIQKRIEQEAIEKQLKRLQQQELQQAKKLSTVNSRIPTQKQKPYWFNDLLLMGFQQEQVWFAIEIKGYDPESVQNFLIDNM